jgi:hypothetical protein
VGKKPRYSGVYEWSESQIELIQVMNVDDTNKSVKVFSIESPELKAYIKSQESLKQTGFDYFEK